MNAAQKLLGQACQTRKLLESPNFRLEHAGLLWKYFHLRPTASGCTIVCNHALFPMRGLNRIPSNRRLEAKLLELDRAAASLASGDEGAFREQMLALGFRVKRRRTA